MPGEIRWVSNMKARWFVARHGSSLVYVELKGTSRKGNPVLVRTIKVVGKHGRVQDVYSEVYSLDKAKEIVEAELALIRMLEGASGGDARSLLRGMRSAVIRLESLVNQLKVMLQDLEEMVGGEKDGGR